MASKNSIQETSTLTEEIGEHFSDEVVLHGNQCPLQLAILNGDQSRYLVRVVPENRPSNERPLRNGTRQPINDQSQAPPSSKTTATQQLTNTDKSQSNTSPDFGRSPIRNLNRLSSLSQNAQDFNALKDTIDINKSQHNEASPFNSTTDVILETTLGPKQDTNIASHGPALDDNTSSLNSSQQNIVPAHLCSSTTLNTDDSHRSLRDKYLGKSSSSRRSRTKAFFRFKSEGRVKTSAPTVPPPSLPESQSISLDSEMSSEYLQERRRSRQRSQQHSSDMDKSSSQSMEQPAPAAKLIESRRRKKRDRSLDEKAHGDRRSGSLRSSRSKSVSNIFQKTFSLRKKDNPMVPRTELSTEDTAPGVLRIFGPAISPGTQYKSVLVSSNSTAEELVKEALDRYTISREYARHFVLCDVIGQFVLPRDTHSKMKVEGIWQEECIRIIGDNERPLILQSFWKPSEGFSRRFELRNRGEFVSLDKLEYRPFEGQNIEQNKQPKTATNHGVTDSSSDSIRSSKNREKNSNKTGNKSNTHASKKAESQDVPQLSQQDLESSTSSSLSDLALIQAQMKQYVDADTDFEASHQSASYRDLKRSNNGENVKNTDTSGKTGSKSLCASVTGADSSSITRIVQDIPFIMTLKGYAPEKDNLVHFVIKEQTLVGCDMLKLSSDDICLSATDILNQHCHLTKHLLDPESPVYHCSIDPCTGANVRVNNQPITTQSALQPGDIIALGNHYIFMYRNPPEERSIGQDSFAIVRLLTSGTLAETGNSNAQNNFVYGDQMSPPPSPIWDEEMDGETSERQTESPLPPYDEESPEDLAWREARRNEYDSDERRLKLAYPAANEDLLLTRILCSLDKEAEGAGPSVPGGAGLYPLTPAYFLAMCMEYSAVTFPQTHTRQLLLKIASRVQATVLERTRRLAETQPSLTVPASEALEELVPDIRPVVIWLANSLELFYWFRTRMRLYLREPSTALPPESLASIAGAESQVLEVIEDVVMYTFQQTVYYITKTLYTALSALLESNPFHDGDSSAGSERSAGMDTLLAVYQSTLQLMLEHQAHPGILAQLFCYLFFFTQTSLINTLLTEDGARRYYKWASGARLRGNLDVLEAWAADNHLSDEASMHLRKLNNMVDLLAMPKLKQADWTSLRADFPHLSPAQLHYVLSHYHVGGASRNRPAHWQASSEEQEQAFNQEDLLESYNNHPALVLPSSGYSLDLNRQVPDQRFYSLLAQLNGNDSVQFPGEEIPPPLGDTAGYLSETEYCRQISHAAQKTSHRPSNLAQFHVTRSSGRPTRSPPPSPPPDGSTYSPSPSPSPQPNSCEPPLYSPPPPPLDSEPPCVPWYRQQSGSPFAPTHRSNSSKDSTDMNSPQGGRSRGMNVKIQNSDNTKSNDQTKRTNDRKGSFENDKRLTESIVRSMGLGDSGYASNKHYNSKQDTIGHNDSAQEQKEVEHQHRHVRDNSNRSQSSEGTSSRMSNYGSGEHLNRHANRDSKKGHKTYSRNAKLETDRSSDKYAQNSVNQYRFVYDFEEQFLPAPDAIPKQYTHGYDPEYTHNTATYDFAQNEDDGETDDPLYMNYHDLEDSQRGSVRMRNGVVHDISKDDPFAMSTPCTSTAGSAQTSPQTNHPPNQLTKQTFGHSSNQYGIGNQGSVSSYGESSHSGRQYSGQSSYRDRPTSSNMPVSNHKNFSGTKEPLQPYNTINKADISTEYQSDTSTRNNVMQSNPTLQTNPKKIPPLIKPQTFSSSNGNTMCDSGGRSVDTSRFPHSLKSPSEENVVEVSTPVSTPRGGQGPTVNNLRVLPVGTEEQNNQQRGKEPSRRENTAPINGSSSSRVTEAEMDELLHSSSRRRGATGRRGRGGHVTQGRRGATNNGGSGGIGVEDGVFELELEKGSAGLGLGLIDGLYTAYGQPGIYVRTLVPGGAAHDNGLIDLGDRILAVNNDSVEGADYQSVMNLIKNGGKKITFIVKKGDRKTALQITASSC